jgi:peptidyl-prolyl cis-trans isomerase D
MLEQMRKSSQSLLIYVLFGIVIAVFIVNFGPQSQGGCDAQMGGDEYAAKVAGDVISTNDFRYGFLVLGGAQYPAQIARQQRIKETVMDKLIERELLAQEAERLGFRVTEEEVEDFIADAKIIGLGYPRTIPQVQKDGKFDYEAFKKFVQFELGLTPKAFLQEQRREMLASRVRELLRTGVKVSNEEVKSDFERKGRQVNLEYVRFPARRYEADLAPTPAELAEFAKTNEAKLKELYQQKKFVYEKVPKEARLRQILIKTSTPDTDKAAEKKAQSVVARLGKGEPFAKLAKEISADPATKGKGGDLGWRRKGGTGLDPAAEEKVLAAKAGEVVGPLKTGEGWVIMLNEGSREGDLPFDKVKLELAEEKLRQDRAQARAKADAQAALTKARAASGKTLKDLYPPKTETDDKGAATRAETDAALAKADETPRAEETGLFSRRGGREGAVVEGIGVSSELAKAAFELKPDAPVAGPFDVAGSYVVVRLKERKDPDMTEFEKKKSELVRDAEMTKWIEVLTDWTQQRCMEAKGADRIRINRESLRYDDSKDPAPYEPCMARKALGG